MNNTEIKEFKKYVRETLVKKYNMTEVEAHRAVSDSYLSSALQRDKDYVEHDSRRVGILSMMKFMENI